MEAAILVLSAAQTLFAALQCSQLKEICSLWSYETELERLQNTVSTIKSVLLDAEAKEVLNHQHHNFVEKLKVAVYDADDLLDEFTVLAEQQQQLLKGGKVSKKVRLLFSRFGKLGVARKMSQQVKKIRKELEGIASDATKFSFKVDYEPIRRRRADSCSYVHERDVIGRETETEDIVNRLISPDVVQGDVSVLAIVGMGGLGKTTLAQLVYQDERVINEFPLRLWACVSDQDQDQLLLLPTLAKILESATGQKQDGSGIELVQTQLRRRLQGKKYLLILDDVWTEDRDEWIKLENFLMGGGKGSRVVVTTRSKRTAQIMGSNNPYELKGLSEENSWLLFERFAFEEGERQRDRHELVGIGREIVKKCAYVPLSIRVIGSLLYGQGKQKWLEFQQHGLAMIKQGENPIMPILKLSYHHLHPSLKSCFSYCAIFPKDFVIEKEKLISLWMAQGYIEPLSAVQSIEDASEEYFLILLRRCFFQDVVKDRFGEIYFCKMHDLMHDMAQEIAGKEICVADSTTSSLDKKTRHVYDAFGNYAESFFTNIKMRTYLLHGGCGFGFKFPFNSIMVTKWMCLRVLDLSDLGVRTLPDSIGNLLHLRYIDLSSNDKLEMLPESVTNLHYLQSLFLSFCWRLKALPKDFSNLVNLRLLDVYSSGLTCMPCGMAKLTCLRRLTMFVVSDRNSGSKQRVGDLEVLRALSDLKGDLTIQINKKYKYVKEEGRECRYLSNKKNLNSIKINWGKKDRENEGRVDGEEALLEDLQPHHNLKGLDVYRYNGVRWPTWGREEKLETFLPNLVRIYFGDCHGLQELPSLGKLQCLKSIVVWDLDKLEYMENTSGCGSVEAPMFPSLERLELESLPKLKGWWRGSSRSYGDDQLGPWVSFPRLSQLTIRYCPDLTSIPFCPTVEELFLKRFNERVRIIMRDEKEVGGACTSASPAYSDSGNRKLRRVETDNGRYLKCLPMGAFQNLTEMAIEEDHEIESLSQVREVLRSCSSSLRSLELRVAPKLGSLFGGGLEHLTALESLTLHNLPSLSLNEDEEEEGTEIMPWRCLHQSLRSLTLRQLSKVVNLPKGMHYLTSLQSLYLKEDDNLEALPEWIAHLSSLQSLYIHRCKKLESMRQLTSLTKLSILNCSERLEERCRSPAGEDWPKIQHIPDISIFSPQNRIRVSSDQAF